MGLNAGGRIRRSHLYWQLVFFALVLTLLFVVVRGLNQVLTPVAAALVLSYLLDPSVSWLQRRLHLPRWLGTTVIFSVTTLVMVAVLLVVLPLVVRELRVFAESIPGYVTRIRNTVGPWLESHFNISAPESWRQLPEGLVEDLRQVASKLVAPIGGVAGKVARGTASVVSALGTLLLIPIFTFYFLPLFPRILAGAEDLIPRRYLPWVRSTAAEIDKALAAWIRGQLTVMTCLALLYSVGLSIVGVKLAVLIGVLTGLLAFIPYVGVVVGLSMALLVSLLEYHGIGTFVGIAVVFGAVQALEGLVLTPKLVGDKVGLGPVGVLLALMLGAHLFGFIGVLLAVPTAAALVVVLRRAICAYRESYFYRRGAPEAPSEPPPAEGQ